jgi:hypothetical protein
MAKLRGKLLNDSKRWRERAEEAWTHAEQFDDPEARRIMFEIAAGYERLAALSEQRLRTPERQARPD